MKGYEIEHNIWMRDNNGNNAQGVSLVNEYRDYTAKWEPSGRIKEAAGGHSLPGHDRRRPKVQSYFFIPASSTILYPVL